MAFKTKGQLNDHQNIHSNYRPFKCDFCQAAFNRKTRLKVHIMIHTGEKPFTCDYPNCNKKFRERGNLNSHYKKHFKFIENKSIANTAVSGDDIFLLGNNKINNKEIQFLNDSSFLNNNYNESENNINNNSINEINDNYENNNDEINPCNNLNNNDIIDKAYGFDNFNNDFFSLNELNLLCEKDEKYENNLINESNL